MTGGEFGTRKVPDGAHPERIQNYNVTRKRMAHDMTAISRLLWKVLLGGGGCVLFASAGFTLQSSTNLAVQSWVNVPSPMPQIVGGQWQVTLPLPAGAGSVFYRLSK